MNEAMKKENIETFVKEKGLDIAVDRNCLYAQVDAKLWQYALFQGAAVFNIKHVLLLFGDRKLTIVGVTMSGDFSDTISTIAYEQLSAFKFKKSIMLQSTLSFQLDKDKYVFKIPNVIMVAKWQKDHLNYLQEKNFFIRK